MHRYQLCPHAKKLKCHRGHHCPYAKKDDCELFEKIHLHNGVTPLSTLGEDWDWCLTKDGLYEKKLALTPSGLYLNASGSFMTNPSGLYVPMGVNTVMGSGGMGGYNPQGTQWYLNSVAGYVLVWSTSSSGYWWLNKINGGETDSQARARVEGSCNMWLSWPTNPESSPNSATLPVLPNGGWSGQGGYSPSTMTWTRGGSGVYEMQWVKVADPTAFELYRRR